MTPEHRSVIIDSVGIDNLRAYCRALLSILTGLQRDAKRSADALEPFIKDNVVACAGRQQKRLLIEKIEEGLAEAEIHLTNQQSHE